MAWQIEYWDNGSKKNPIEKWFEKLSREEFKAITKELNMLEELGNELKLPHSRSLGKGLFELRERKFGYRLYYCFKENTIILLLTAGDKKSQAHDIEIARERLLKS